MDLEWIAEDNFDTLGHATKMTHKANVAISPEHALTQADLGAINTVEKSISNGLSKTMMIASESLAYQTFKNVGMESGATEALYKRLKAKIVQDRINVVYTRIPSKYVLGEEKVIPVGKIPEIKASTIVGVQLEAGTDLVVPPLPAGIQNRSVFDSVFERTKIEIQTFKKEKEIMGYIPTTGDLPLAAYMIEAYIKNGVKIFGIDFSGSPLQRWLVRTVVRAIRKNLKIKKNVGEQTSKQYYLHIFNVPSSKKSVQPVAPISDLLTHAYGVDSTSGVIWGGGRLEKEKLRIYNTQDYGAYRVKDLGDYDVVCKPSLLEGSPKQAYDKLRGKRLYDYAKECRVITDKMANAENAYSYAPHLASKQRVVKEVKNILMDVKEIKAH